MSKQKAYVCSCISKFIKKTLMQCWPQPRATQQNSFWMLSVKMFPKTLQSNWTFALTQRNADRKNREQLFCLKNLYVILNINYALEWPKHDYSRLSMHWGIFSRYLIKGMGDFKWAVLKCMELVSLCNDDFSAVYNIGKLFCMLIYVQGYSACFDVY